MNNIIYVTGHRHPDSDAICASIAYTDLLNRTGQTAVACRQGPLNEETKFILKRFGLENPLLMTDARAMLCDIDLDQPTVIGRDETVHHAWHVMLHSRTKSLFVVDESGKLCGLCSTSDLSRTRIDSDVSLHRLMSTASLEKIARTIGGEIKYAPDEFRQSGIVHIITVQEWELSRFDLAGGISILSADEEMQKKLIEIGARCLVITCGQTVSNEVVALAKEHGCGLITTEQDTMHTAKVITESYSVSQVMTKNVMSFNQNEYVEDVASKMANTRVRSYPVLDDDGYIVGAISRYHTRSYNRRKIALVDHSAVNQSIGNIDKAQIVAIVDHHHIGNIQTDLPIEYRNHRCGCTCTIISKLYKENGLLPDAQISGIMMSAILSDTLNFRSATTTDEDRETVRWLAARAGITDIDAYAREMLGASVALKDSTPHEILNRDLKNYEIGKYKIAIGQTNYSHIEDVQKLLPEFRANMEQEQAQKNLDLLVMLFTDVMGEGSQFVFYGPLSYVMKDIVETIFDDHSGFDPNIISRKQQMMPKLSQLIKEI
ncbi:MAG: putative manganese-dependent inorganic diphosphatase [Erysipelotrichaceae bacterium]|nr:putative manganese-dependent inorganic diphosphatase [Erysipelotrichaceae bacterium]